jgi:hypothetical protein
MDEAPYEHEVQRALLMTLLVAYYRSRPGDTRLEQAALAELPAEHRAMASRLLARTITTAKKQARYAEAERAARRRAALVES